MYPSETGSIESMFLSPKQPWISVGFLMPSGGGYPWPCATKHRNHRIPNVQYSLAPQKIARYLSLPETHSSDLKIDPWKRRFLLKSTIFRSFPIKNQWLEDVFPIDIHLFLGDMLVFGRIVPFLAVLKMGVSRIHRP